MRESDQRDRRGELPARDAPVGVGPAVRQHRRRRGRSDHPGLHDRRSASTRARPPRSASRSTRPPRYRLDIYRMGYYDGLGARRISDHRCARRPPRPARVPHRGADRADRLRQLERVGDVDRSGRRRLGHLFRQGGPRTTPAARATSCSSCATTTGSRTCCSRRPTRRGRPTTTTAATACTPARPAGPRLQGELQPAVHARARRAPGRTTAGCSAPNTRWCAGSKPTATTSATSPASTPIGAGARADSSTGCSCRSATTSTGRGRSGRTSRRRATRACTWRSSAATRCSGRRGGSRASTAATRRTARWSATRKRTPTRKIDPEAAIWTGTWRDPRRSTRDDGGAAGERADRHDLHGQRRARRRDHGAGVVRAAPLLAQYQHRGAAAGADGDPAAGHARLRMGRGSRQRLPSRRPAAAVLDDDRRHAADLLDYGSNYGRGHGDAQPDAVPARRAARWCSAPARCSGRGASTRTTTAHGAAPSLRACSRRR